MCIHKNGTIQKEGKYSGVVYNRNAKAYDYMESMTISYSGTLQEAIAGYKETAYTAISRAMDPDHGEVIRQGRLIQ
jgi:repressor of nif and glnA expression